MKSLITTFDEMCLCEPLSLAKRVVRSAYMQALFHCLSSNMADNAMGNPSIEMHYPAGPLMADNAIGHPSIEMHYPAGPLRATYEWSLVVLVIIWPGDHY